MFTSNVSNDLIGDLIGVPMTKIGILMQRALEILPALTMELAMNLSSVHSSVV